MSTRNTFSVPTLPSEFDTFQKTVVPIFVAKALAYGIPPTSITNLAPKKIKWDGFVLTCDTPTTAGPGATANRNDFQPEYSQEISIIIEDFLLNNIDVTPADALSFHIHPLASDKAALPAPTSTVVGKVTYQEPLAHYFSFSDSVTGKRAKPKGVSFVELRYLIAVLPPAVVTDCTEVAFLNRSKTKIVFDGGDEGKKAFYFGRYVNKNGDAGPWCAMFSAGII